MKVKKFTIPMYDFAVTVIEVKDGDNIKKVLKACEFKKGEDYYKEVKDSLDAGYHNGGHFFYDFRKRRGLILLYHQTSKKRRLDCIGHEKRHLEDRLLNYYNVKDDEAAAMLAGYLTKKIL